jgi:hypothetical protein
LFRRQNRGLFNVQRLLSISLIALLAGMAAVPAAQGQTTTQFGFLNPGPTTPCQKENLVDDSLVSSNLNVTVFGVFGLVPGASASVGPNITIPDGQAAYFVATIPVGEQTSFTAGVWNLSLAGVTTGLNGFNVTLGVINTTAGCVFEARSVPGQVLGGSVLGSSAPVQPFVLIVLPHMTLQADERLALRIVDTIGAGSLVSLGGPPPPGTTISLSPTLLLKSTEHAFHPGYPVPGPGSFIVMALGALAVFGRVWMLRNRSN